MNKKGVLATFDALTFFMLAIVISLVITVAVMKTQGTEDLKDARQDMDESTYSLSVILQYGIESTSYKTRGGEMVTLEDMTVLNLLDFILTNKELGHGHNTASMENAIEQEIDGVLSFRFRLTASSDNHEVAIPDIETPRDVITTSVSSPASGDLGSITVVLWTWE